MFISFCGWRTNINLKRHRLSTKLSRSNFLTHDWIQSATPLLQNSWCMVHAVLDVLLRHA
ncbi:hypothetical protein LINPERPRIM_LOCUS2024 [Linum perenne]